VEKLEELLKFIVEELVETKEEVKIATVRRNDNIVLKVRVADGELGRVIGKNGLTASAIRGVVQAAGVKDKLNVNVEFLD
jgi:predicted RNA-binding protein YlqC (UPF0109 family)